MIRLGRKLMNLYGFVQRPCLWPKETIIRFLKIYGPISLSVSSKGKRINHNQNNKGKEIDLKFDTFFCFYIFCYTIAFVG